MTIGHRKSIRKIQFTIMVCGVSGTGRTSFVNALCGQKVLEPYKSDQEIELRAAHSERSVSIVPRTIDIDELDGTRTTLTIIDTPGFGDSIDNSIAFNRILGYIESQYDEILAEESRIRRNPRFKDNRVHVCLYFIEWTGHGLRQIDIEMMKRLGRRVNVIPILSRCDSLTVEEKDSAKQMIMEDIQKYEIPVFLFPSEPEDDEETMFENEHLRSLVPFGIVSGNTAVTLPDGSQSLGRVYPWGVIDGFDPHVSDFSSLKSALLGSHMLDLRDLTHDVLYENYRTEKLSGNLETTHGSVLLEAEDLAKQSYAIKEARLRKEEENIRGLELQVQREIEEKKNELVARENELREIEARITRERQESRQGSRHESRRESLMGHNTPLQQQQEQFAQDIYDVPYPPIERRSVIMEKERSASDSNGIPKIPPIDNRRSVSEAHRRTSRYSGYADKLAENGNNFGASINGSVSNSTHDSHSSNNNHLPSRSGYSPNMSGYSNNHSSPEDSMRQLKAVTSPYVTR